jgi:phenylacetate-coenzyme A ligase PaaK-like adenylate-forming protein
VSGQTDEGSSMSYSNNRPTGQASRVGVGPLTAFAAEAWGFLHHSTDLWLAGIAGPEVIRARATHRLNTLVAHARRHSKFYRDLYQGLAPGRLSLEQLPSVTKSKLMANWDDWVTRSDLKLDATMDFTQDPARIGRPYLGQYAVWMSRHTRAFSVLQSVQEVSEHLSNFAPEIVTSYASELVALAEQQHEGRLALQLKGVWSGGETLSRRDRADIAGAFGCPVVDDYGASEFLNIAFDCGCGALHLNRDWVILEAVDREGHPVPDGTASSTVLLTNLANFIQPIIRYDLGDSVTFLPEPCPCGSLLPALRVEGRCDDTICLERPDGRLERVIPLALCTAIEERAGVYRFQVVEEAANQLMLRIDPYETNEDANQVAARTEECIRVFCAELGARNVIIRTDPGPPQINPVSGKLRRICARRDPGPTQRGAEAAGPI